MRIFVKEKEHNYVVDKVIKTADGWDLSFDKTRHLSIRSTDYSGNLPPKKFLPWQKHHLHLFCIDNFVYKAIFDETLLYEIPEEKYPERIKEAIAKDLSLQQEVEAQWKAEDDHIKNELAEFLKNFPARINLDLDVKELEFLMRGYFRFHYFNGEPDEDYRKRLSLMFVIAQIAVHYMKRHIGTNPNSWDKIDHLAMTLRSPFPGYRHPAEMYEDACADSGGTKGTLDRYYELKKLLTQYLPEITDESLLRYLNDVCQIFLYQFHNDFADFHERRHRNIRGEFIHSEKSDYKEHYASLKLTNFKSFILTDIVSDEDKAVMIRSYLFD